MRTSADLEESVRKIVAKVLRRSCESIQMESRLREDLNADSLDLVLLLYELEDRLEVKLSDAEARSITTVRDAVRLAGRVAHP
jgi:acyl carrier protein